MTSTLPTPTATVTRTPTNTPTPIISPTTDKRINRAHPT
jgi:hypothetical protein